MAAHKFRTNLDSLTKLDRVSEYTTIIFCEYCGYVKYDTNRSQNRNPEPSEKCPLAPEKDLNA